MNDESGGTPEQRTAEARRVLKILLETDFDEFQHKDRKFIEEMSERFDRYGDKTSISPRQLFWLRDIKDRSLRP